MSLSETPGGFSASEVTGMAPEQVRRAAQALVKAGDLVRVRIGPRSVRYFRSAATAAAYQAAHGKLSPPKPALVGPRSKAAWSVDDPPIITSRTIFTQAAPLPGRVLKTNTYQQF